MKRLIAAAVTVLAAGSVLAQAGPFTIRRPVDGAKVREIVKVRIPRTAMTETSAADDTTPVGYIGVYLNDKFLEAVAPDLEGDDFVYKMDTKARGIPDGEVTIELVHFMRTETGPIVADRTSVMVMIDNHTSIPIPDEGLDLRYKFYNGKEFNYTMVESVSVSMISQALAQIGSRGTQTSLETETMRFMYAHDNSFETDSGAQGLVRIQPLTDKGKDHTFLTMIGDTEPRKYMDYEMHPWYMRMNDKGREVFSAAPSFSTSDFGASGESFRTDLFVMMPPPVLPARPVRPGDTWQSPYLQMTLELEDKDKVDKFTTGLPARGTFEGVEWQGGIPCAKLRSMVAVGAEDLKDVGNLTEMDGDPSRIELEELIWFALDTGVMIRRELNTTIEALVEVGTGGGGGAGTAPGAAGGADGGPSFAGASSGGGGGNAATANYIRDIFGKGFRHFNVQTPPPGAGGPPGGARGPRGNSGPGNTGGFQGRTGSTSGSGPKQIMRVRSQAVIELERD
jgi:hypothetical protein